MTRSELLQALAGRIQSVERDHPLRIAIDGVDAAGKTVLADELGETLRHRGDTVIRASVDGFHNPRAVRQRRGLESPEGYYRDSFDYAAVIRLILEPLGPGGTRSYRRSVFDFRTDQPVDSPFERASEDAILLFEGVFLQRPELRSLWDVRIFVRASFETTVRRAMERDQYLFGDAEKVRHRYETRYVPGQRLYIDECNPEIEADVVVDNDDPLRPTLLLR